MKSQDRRILLDQEPSHDSKRHIVTWEDGRLAQVTVLIHGRKGCSAFGTMGQLRISAPFRDAVIAFPTLSVLWSAATYVRSHATPLVTSLGFLRNESAAGLLFV